jgi:hypothetical protein
LASFPTTGDCHPFRAADFANHHRNGRPIVVVSGLILVPLPGAGWLIALGGVAMWPGIRLGKTCSGVMRHQLEGRCDRVNQRHRSVHVQVGLSGLPFVGAVAWALR